MHRKIDNMQRNIYKDALCIKNLSEIKIVHTRSLSATASVHNTMVSVQPIFTAIAMQMTIKRRHKKKNRRCHTNQ